MYRVYGDLLSRNCYKIRLLMQLLAIDHDWQHMAILAADTHVAHEGGFDLEPHRHINAWLQRIAALPNYVAMPVSAS